MPVVTVSYCILQDIRTANAGYWKSMAAGKTGTLSFFIEPALKEALSVGAVVLTKSVMGGLHHEYSLAPDVT